MPQGRCKYTLTRFINIEYAISLSIISLSITYGMSCQGFILWKIWYSRMDGNCRAVSAEQPSSRAGIKYGSSYFSGDYFLAATCHVKENREGMGIFVRPRRYQLPRRTTLALPIPWALWNILRAWEHEWDEGNYLGGSLGIAPYLSYSISGQKKEVHMYTVFWSEAIIWWHCQGQSHSSLSAATPETLRVGSLASPCSWSFFRHLFGPKTHWTWRFRNWWISKLGQVSIFFSWMSRILKKTHSILWYTNFRANFCAFTVLLKRADRRPPWSGTYFGNHRNWMPTCQNVKLNLDHPAYRISCGNHRFARKRNWMIDLSVFSGDAVKRSIFVAEGPKSPKSFAAELMCIWIAIEMNWKDARRKKMRRSMKISWTSCRRRWRPQNGRSKFSEWRRVEELLQW